MAGHFPFPLPLPLPLPPLPLGDLAFGDLAFGDCALSCKKGQLFPFLHVPCLKKWQGRLPPLGDGDRGLGVRPRGALGGAAIVGFVCIYSHPGMSQVPFFCSLKQGFSDLGLP